MNREPLTISGRRLTFGHAFVGSRDSDGGYDTSDGSCALCAEDWPCPTVRLVPLVEDEARAMGRAERPYVPDVMAREAARRLANLERRPR